ncbi:MAG: hypothetical protein D8M58_21505 [Calditrichaeota bacterium]|nr:MAG: hypothetical protein DWQ03_00230 [Calditrichota bacterium]MBL1207991.1 hypothetical protein [Calditrichota bacterium]NOG47828.1 hypothetical protein [Calditrichota bacterium]
MSSRKIWLTILPLLFLLATFEHCYSILSLYGQGLLFPFVTTTLLVLAIDSSIYFSMQHIQLLPARIILLLAATISITLNVKYMIDWKPPGTFALIIGITVGFLIPAMLGLFGWLEKEIRESIMSTSSNGQLQEVVKFHIEKYPDMSSREIAGLIGCSHTTVRKYADRNRFSN